MNPIRNRKRTKEEWLQQAHEVHRDKYDYSLVDFNKKSSEHVDIICPIHGKFSQVVRTHLSGGECPKCSRLKSPQYKKLSKEDFIKRTQKVHSNKYDYSRAIYINYNTKVEIVCSKHGSFFMTPSNHVLGQGCPKCKLENISKRQLFTKEQNLEILNKVHRNKYDYSLAEFPDPGENPNKKIKIICPIHGVFEQALQVHRSGQGCPECKKIRIADSLRSSTEEFIEKSKRIHGDKYDYSKVNYINNREKVEIICPIHGSFYQKPNSHLSGQGCPECSGNKRLTTEEFIKRAREIHGNKYDYSKTEYKNRKTKVEIICPDHGSFYQTPFNHLIGAGCPVCKESRGETQIRRYLESHNIDFESQKSFKGLGRMKFDFYLPSYNLCIEYQGEQHYKPFKYFGGEESFRKRIKRDNLKKIYCETHNINLLEIKYDEDVESSLNKYLESKQRLR